MADEIIKTGFRHHLHSVRTWGVNVVRNTMGGLGRSISRLGSWVDAQTSGGLRQVVIVAAGVDEQAIIDAKSREELNKFLGIGAIVCVTASWAFLGANFFFQELLYPSSVVEAALDRPWYGDVLRYLPILLLSLLWGMMVFQIDRVFLTTMLGQTGLRRLGMGLIRITLAALLGYCISHPLKLRFFENDIDSYRTLMIEREVEQLAEVRRAELDVAEEKLQEIREAIGEIDTESTIVARVSEIETAIDIIELFQTAEDNGDKFIPSQREPGKSIEGRNSHNLTFPIFENGRSLKFNFTMSGSSTCPKRSKYAKINNKIDDFKTEEGIKSLANIYVNSREIIRVNGTLGPDEGLLNCEFLILLGRAIDAYLDDIKTENDFEYGAENSNAARLGERTSLKKQEQEATLDVEQKKVALQETTLQATVEEQLGYGYATDTRLLWELTTGAGPDALTAKNSQEPVDATDRIALQRQLDTQRKLETFIDNAETFWWISTAIVAIFVFVESAPILAKLMSEMGPYERSIAVRLATQRDEAEDGQRNARDARNAESKAKAERTILDAEATLARSRLHQEYAIGFEERLAAGLAEELKNAKSLSDFDRAVVEYQTIREHMFGSSPTGAGSARHAG